MFRKISKRNRMLCIAVPVILILGFVVPIWYISLQAPQYPDGLSMSIWINRITGGSEFDLDKINLLNHYIGMKTIHPESFVEFKYMPYVLAFLTLVALAAVFYHRLIMIITALASFVVAAGAGFIVFWRWEYDYGHNLNPKAAIKFPDMSFQPPLIGCQDMLNINACSWPNVGGILLFIAGGILIFIIYDEIKRQRTMQG